MSAPNEHERHVSALKVYAEDDAARPLLDTEDAEEIARVLAGVGVRFERWSATTALSEGAGPADVLAAYAADVARLQRAGGYRAVDVIRMHADHPDRAALRDKFLAEHRHGEDEVRFFVEGAGLFCLHIGARVYAVLCTRGDLLSVPANTAHWFDMGTRPRFCAIRLFTDPAGWVAHYTGSDLARAFPDFHAHCGERAP